MNRRFLLIGGAVVLAAAGIGFFALRGKPAPGSGPAPNPAPATAQAQSAPTPAPAQPALPPAIDMNLLLLGVNIAPPDDQFQLAKALVCSAGTGIIATRCEESFIDTARYRKIDYVVIYVLNQASDFAALQTQIEASLGRMPNGNRILINEDFTINDKAGKKVMEVSPTCEQTIGDQTRTYAVCFMPYGANLVITTAVFPGFNVNGFNLEHPPDIDRAEALEEHAILGVYDDLGVNP